MESYRMSCMWLLFLNIVFGKFLHFYYIHFLLMDIGVSSFWLLWIKLLLSVLHMSLAGHIFISLRCVHRRGIVGSDSSYCQTDFQSSCDSVQCMRSLVAPYPYQHLGLSDFPSWGLQTLNHSIDHSSAV